MLRNGLSSQTQKKSACPARLLFWQQLLPCEVAVVLRFHKFLSMSAVNSRERANTSARLRVDSTSGMTGVKPIPPAGHIVLASGQTSAVANPPALPEQSECGRKYPHDAKEV